MSLVNLAAVAPSLPSTTPFPPLPLHPDAKMQPFYINTELLSLAQDITTADFQNFAEKYKDSDINDEIEIHIYCNLQVYKARCQDTAILEETIKRAKKWVLSLSPDDEDYPRRLHILVTVVACGFHNKGLTEREMRTIVPPNISKW